MTLPKALEDLRHALAQMSFPLPSVHGEDAEEIRKDIVRQLEDYILPRYASLDAPLIAVVGGSTGSGKSTLVNSLLHQNIARASAIRPTTRRPLLIHNPHDAHWFNDSRVLPGLARVSGQAEGASSHNELALAASDAVPQGLALLDSPDIDSVVEENRRLAFQLLSAADLWVFVTTAARYADAVPWAMLDEAASRDIVIAVVLDRVPIGDAPAVRSDLHARLDERGLGSAPLFVISEGLGEDGFVPTESVEPIRGWLEGIAKDAAVRAHVARQTLSGAVDKLLADRQFLMEGANEQVAMVERLRGDIRHSFVQAEKEIASGLADGKLLRDEVLERWQEIVGTGELMKRLESSVASVRDRISAAFRGRGKERDFVQVEEAIEDTLLDLIVTQAEEAIANTGAAWQQRAIAQDCLNRANVNIRSHEERYAAGARMVRDWQRELLDMISDEGQSKRATAKVLSWSVNALGAALMIVIFASTSGLTGGEVAVAGGTALLAERVLEAVFGDDAVRRMSAKARESFLARTREFLNADEAPFDAALDEVGDVELWRDALAVAFERAIEEK
ncbi:MAG: dynamin family protein [Actinomycetaceae bacterium]|nr:dynamin family protein [Actinomycetaceae bacterium]